MLSLKFTFQIIAAALVAADISAFGRPKPYWKFLVSELLRSPIYSGPRYDKRGAKTSRGWKSK
jgi:hypothetical protein